MYILYPLLLCLLPIHVLFAENHVEIGLKDYIRTLFFIVFFVCFGVWAFNLLTNNLIVAELCFVINFFLLLYGNYIFIGLFSVYKRSLVKNKNLFIVVYILIMLLSTYLVVKFLPLTFIQFISKMLFWSTLFVSVFIIADIVSKCKELLQKENKSIEVEIGADFSDSPDIYHIITDAHIGFDKPEYCDNFFKDELKIRGFCIYEEAKSNYDFTHCSVPSCLNMDYVQNFMESVNGCYPVSTGLLYMNNNKLFKFLESKGFKLFFSCCNEFTHLFENDKVSGKILKLLFFSSLFSVSKQVYRATYSTRVLSRFQRYIKISRLNVEAPKYAYMHFLAPHFPYLLDENGRKNRKEDYSNPNKYFSYMKYVNKELLKLIDEIKQNMKPNSIIIIHGDHSHLKDIESHKILLTVYFPEGFDSSCIKQNLTLVNLFRCVLNEVFKTDYEILEDKFYHVTWGKGVVTERSSQADNK